MDTAWRGIFAWIDNWSINQLLDKSMVRKKYFQT